MILKAPGGTLLKSVSHPDRTPVWVALHSAKVWRNSDGEWVYFDHTGPGTIHPGEQSRFVVVKTKAKSYSEEDHIWLGWSGAAFGVSGFHPGC